jgi:DNA-binding response OmpR family regulator
MATAMVVTPNAQVIDLRAVQGDKIILVEHDPALRKVLQRLFSTEGYQVEVVSDRTTLLDMLRSREPSAVILDLQSPGLTSCDLCREIRRSAPAIPLIVLSAISEVVDKVLLLEMGADDYMTIPFSPRELLARTRALMRRASRVQPEGIYVFDHIAVDFLSMEVTRAGEIVPLTAKEYKTLEFLIKNARRVISRDELLNEVWGYQNYPCTRTVDNHILRLRKKLENDSSHPAHLLTMHSMGYKFMP